MASPQSKGMTLSQSVSLALQVNEALAELLDWLGLGGDADYDGSDTEDPGVHPDVLSDADEDDAAPTAEWRAAEADGIGSGSGSGKIGDRSRSSLLAKALGRYPKGVWLLKPGESRAEFVAEKEPGRWHPARRPDECDESGAFLSLWHQDEHVLRVRKLTRACASSLRAVDALHAAVAQFIKPYGRRDVRALNFGVQAREGNVEGGEGESDGESAAAARGRRYVAESGREAAPLGCSSGAAGGAAAVSRDELQLAAASGVTRTKHLVPVEHAASWQPAVRQVAEALRPAAEHQAASFLQEDPEAYALQHASVRAGLTRIAPLTPKGEYSITECGAWSNVALYWSGGGGGGGGGGASNGAGGSASGDLDSSGGADAARAAETCRQKAKRQKKAPAAAKQRPLGPHTDSLNALYGRCPWLWWAAQHKRADLIDALRRRDVHGAIGSRRDELEELRRELGIDELAAAEAQLQFEEQPRSSRRSETTAIFNHVAVGELSGGHLGLLVGTDDGSPIPRGDLARLDLIISGKARMSWLPLDYECQFDARHITHVGTEVIGVGVNVRAILFATMALETTLGHVENVTPGQEPYIMNRAMKREAVAAQVLCDTSKPSSGIPPELAAKAAARWIGGGDEPERNAYAHVMITLRSLAERFAREDSECAAFVAEAARARSNSAGCAMSPPSALSMEAPPQGLKPQSLPLPS